MGYVNVVSARTPQTKLNRLQIVTILVENGAEIDLVDKISGMTPLHWAAYHDDSDLVKFLLKKGAKIKFSLENFTPVDIAGFCQNANVVKVFCRDLEKFIEAEADELMNQEFDLVTGLGGSQQKQNTLKEILDVLPDLKDTVKN